jgi:hypothetical protein
LPEKFSLPYLTKKGVPDGKQAMGSNQRDAVFDYFVDQGVVGIEGSLIEWLRFDSIV